ncbi:erythrocyte membrane protein 1, PfEMP1, putative [Plasmodium sp. gorilla clade G1]|nr:erythrocyte membrane protein 1, PfEMP1, putative [Plasmodium sp. gorilla clade G1]
MAPQGSGGGEDKYKNAPDSKHLLDMIGKDVYETVKKEYEQRSNGDLKGNLTSSSFFGGERASSLNPCTLVENYRTNTISTASAHGDPCGNRTGKEDVKRFSKERVAEYDDKKIESNKCSNGGACAPYRRLSLCNKNLEYINRYDRINAKHYLLAKVCYAAKHEGESISLHYPQYEAQYPGSGSTMCTMLARSFADIGDIVRGKDLYRGNKKEKKQRDELEKNLKDIFGDIYNELTSGRNDKKQSLQALYNDDNKNYFQLREDWWNANRAKVWEALTCDAEGSYFHATCSDGKGQYQAHNKCRCGDGKKPGTNADQVPTYFDYVPQFVRWFEEWTEDFCRKKKKKVENVKKQCRGPSGKDKYCSLNGCDCTKTVRARGKLRYGNRCIDCLYACNPYVHWIDKKKEEFDKQKKQYDEEIKIYTEGASGGSRRQKRGTTTKYEGYEKKFYDKLKNDGYGDVNKFLEKLNNEKECKSITDTKEGTINFAENPDEKSNDAKGTFYHSEYCQVCPYCGMRKKGDGTIVKKREDDQCKHGNLYKPREGAEPTNIKILKSGEKQREIAEKLNEFCDGKNGESLYEAWECYKGEDVVKVENKDEEEDEEDIEDYANIQTAGGLCILKNDKNKDEKKKKKSSKEPADSQKTFHDFFTYWVAHMLKDSIYWRKKLKKFLENEKKKCGNEKYNKECDCFKKWVKQKKEEEWTPIKTHFYKQKNLGEGAGFIKFSPYYILEQNLKLQFLKEDSEDSAEDSQSRDEDAEEMKHLKKILKLENENTLAVVNDGTEENTTIDKLLEQELKDADRCKKCEDPKPESPGRSLDDRQVPIEDHEDSEDEEEDHGPDDQVDEVAVEEDTETTQPEAAPGPPEKKDEVNPCEIVNTLFTTTDTLQKACSTKYEYGHEKFPNWKCVPTSAGDNTTTSEGGDRAGRARRSILIYRSPGATDDVPSAGDGDSRDGVPTTGKDGAICVPPRRRKLYLGGFKRLTDGTAVSSEPTSATSQSPNGDPLLTAFVESAAVETFFLWHKYKVDKEIEKKKKRDNDALDFLPATSSVATALVPGAIPGVPPLGGPRPVVLGNGLKSLASGAINGYVPSSDSDEQTPEKLLQRGHIPPDFLRLMFYTLADYKDILEGKNIVVDMLSASSGSDKEMKAKEEKIKGAISSYFSNSVSTPPPTPVPQTQPSDKRKSWWTKHGPSIWEGMICALTYKENDARGTPLTQDKQVESALIKDGKPNPPNDYNTVKLDDQSETEARTNDQPTKLSDFVEIPTYFRYLQEWGENFCKERRKRLEKIKEECKVEDDEYKCSGYGEDCKNNLSEKYDTVPFLVQSCADSCRLYKRWIKGKEDEFFKQKNAYTEQQNKCQSKSDKAESDNGVCGTVKTCDTAAAFLERLKIRSCKKDNDSGEHKTGDDYIKFDDRSKDKTFGHENYCDPCPKFTVDCKNGKCDNDKGGDCNGKNSIDATDIENRGRSTEILDMLVSDNSKSGFENGLEACRGANIFKGIRKEQWKCDKVCGYNVCKPEKGNDKHIITIRALVTHWVHNFLEDYNRIKKKLKPCTKNDLESTCISGCKDKCTCVEKWVSTKKNEWRKIKKRFLNQYKIDSDEYYPVKTILEGLISRIAAATDKAERGSLDKLKTSLGCNCPDNSQKTGGEDGTKEDNDLVLCLLDKLGEKAKKCKDQSSGENLAQCDTLPPDLDEEPLEEDENTTNTTPNICPPTPEPEPVDEGGCTPDAPQPDVKEEEEEKEEEKDKGNEETEQPAPDMAPKKEENVVPKPPPPPKKRRIPRRAEDPLLRPTLVTSTLAWSVGIGFATLTYWWLKKKSKPPVDLLRVLNIPKGDYDIPTLKSSNRYIPYGTDKYRGKRYIYVEGDTDEDKYMFMSDTTDVTSSESEYEELDINEIYPYQSPKYKTLIEVVLEPSKRDVQSDDTPSSDTPSNKFTDNEWNQLKKDFISNMLQNTQNTEPNILHDNVDNNTHPTMSRHNVDQKPFIMSIHDRNLLSGEKYNYDMSTNSGNNDLYSGIDPTSANHDSYSGKHGSYSGIDLINDALNGDYDIYDEMLKRKENELFGTKHHTKRTSTQNVAKPARDDPIHNQLDLFHKWLDRHRDLYKKWNNKEGLLDKLKEEWNKDTNSGKLSDNIHSDNKPGDIPSDNHVLNSDVSIQIDMGNPKYINQFTCGDSNPNLTLRSNPNLMGNQNPNLNLVENNINPNHQNQNQVGDTNFVDTPTNPTNVQIEMSVKNHKLVKEKYPIADVWDI